MKRVVITGVGAVSPLGRDVKSLVEGLEAGKNAVCYMEEWSRYNGMDSHVAAPAELRDEKNIPRQKRRSMGRMSFFAVQASEQALADSGIKSDYISNRTGCIIGSTTGSAGSISRAFEIMLFEKDLSRLPSSWQHPLPVLHLFRLSVRDTNPLGRAGRMCCCAEARRSFTLR
jgi:3-oxoacyl-[acyl-carrier-protein] synthase II